LLVLALLAPSVAAAADEWVSCDPTAVADTDL